MTDGDLDWHWRPQRVTLARDSVAGLDGGDERKGGRREGRGEEGAEGLRLKKKGEVREEQE